MSMGVGERPCCVLDIVDEAVSEHMIITLAQLLFRKLKEVQVFYDLKTPFEHFLSVHFSSVTQVPMELITRPAKL